MNFDKEINIQDKLISNDSRTFVIAEAGVNHGGDMKIAKQLIDIASDAGADAVKFQAFKTENLILEDIKKATYQKKTTGSNETQYEMLKKLEVTMDQNKELKNYCIKKNIIFLTTPFDEQSLDDLDDIDLPAYKIASTDTTNIPFLRRVAKKNKPIILSTGMSYLSEVKLALKTINEFNNEVILLQCTANYPIKDNEANLAVINTYKEHFNILVGYSDHSVGVGAAPYAVSMGAKVVEKHFTISKANAGPDHAASLSPEELKEFIGIIRKVDSFMGTSIKEPSNSELETRQSLQKCLVASCHIKKGDIFSNKNIIAKRTGGQGISPIEFDNIVGQVANRNFAANEVIAIG